MILRYPRMRAQAIMSQGRRNTVKELRPLARLCGVELVRDDCGRENVMHMVQTMRETQAR